MAIDIEKLPPEIKNNPAKLGSILITDKLMDQALRVKHLKIQLAKVKDSNSGIEYSKGLDELFILIDQL